MCGVFMVWFTVSFNLGHACIRDVSVHCSIFSSVRMRSMFMSVYKSVCTCMSDRTVYFLKAAEKT